MGGGDMESASTVGRSKVAVVGGVVIAGSIGVSADGLPEMEAWTSAGGVVVGVLEADVGDIELEERGTVSTKISEGILATSLAPSGTRASSVSSFDVVGEVPPATSARGDLNLTRGESGSGGANRTRGDSDCDGDGCSAPRSIPLGVRVGEEGVAPSTTAG